MRRAAFPPERSQPTLAASGQAESCPCGSGGARSDLARLDEDHPNGCSVYFDLTGGDLSGGSSLAVSAGSILTESSLRAIGRLYWEPASVRVYEGAIGARNATLGACCISPFNRCCCSPARQLGSLRAGALPRAHRVVGLEDMIGRDELLRSLKTSSVPLVHSSPLAATWASSSQRQ